MAFKRLWRRTEKQRSTEQSQVAAINRKEYTVYWRKYGLCNSEGRI